MGGSWEGHGRVRLCILVFDADYCKRVNTTMQSLTLTLALTGYPPEDLLLKPGFISDNVAELKKISSKTHGGVAYW